MERLTASEEHPLFLIRWHQRTLMYRITDVVYTRGEDTNPLLLNVRHKDKTVTRTWFMYQTNDRLLTITEAAAHKLRTLNVIVID